MKTKHITLALEDFAGKSESEIRKHIESEYKSGDTSDYKILIAYESVGSWGCDSSSFFLLRKGKSLFENHASHDSCCGFEYQWDPKPVTLDELKSDKHYIGFGGYDENRARNKATIREYINSLKR